MINHISQLINQIRQLTQTDAVIIGSLAICAIAIMVFAAFCVQLWFSAKQIRESRKGFKDAIDAQREVSRNEIAVGLFLRMTEAFDTPRMRNRRKVLAAQFLNRREFSHNIEDDVLNFFEDLGSLLHRGLLDEYLTYSGFSFYAEGWWSVCASYITYLRERSKDPTRFSEFEYFANRMFELEAQKRKMPRKQLEFDEARRMEFLNNESM